MKAFNLKKLFLPATDFRSERGISLIMVVSIIVGFGLLGLIVTNLVISDTSLLVVHSAKQQAFYAAESGIEYAAAALKDSADWRGTSSVSTGNSEFSISIDDKNTIAALGDTLLVTAVGTSSKYSKTVQAKMLVNIGWTYALLSGNEIDFEKGKGTIKGDVHANKKVKINTGGKGKKGKGKKFTVTGDITVAPPYMSLPVIDWDFFKAKAIAAGQYYEGDLDLAKVSGSKNNETYTGVWYSTKDIKLSGNNNVINGTLVAEKKIKVEKNNNEFYANPTNYPVLISGESVEIEMNNTHVEGLVYSDGDIELEKNNGTFIGGLIAKDELKNDGNNTDVTIDPKYLSNLEGVLMPDEASTTVELITWEER